MSIAKIVSRHDPVTKEEALAEYGEASAPYAQRYRESVTDVDAEVARLTELMLSGIEQSGPRWSVHVRLDALGADLWPQALLACYRQSSRAKERRQFVISAIFEARDSATARELGLLALNDRSYGVRIRASQVLAYSLDRARLPALRNALEAEPRREARESFQAAMKAIEQQNHHLYIDRQERGGCSWGVNPWDSGDPPIQRAKLSYEVDCIQRAWATEV